jgi:hypothetical protein
MYEMGCLVSEKIRIRKLPNECLRQIRTEQRRDVQGYDPRCLGNRGLALSRR